MRERLECCPLILTALAMAFITLLVLSNIIAVKLIAVGGFVLTASIITYPFTLLLSDAIAEIYGRKIATRVVWLGFVLSLLMVLILYLAQVMPGAEVWGAQGAYEQILCLVPRVVLASMVAYVIAQNHDVFAFHYWRNLTKGRHLWLRNTASSVVSQALDTVLFVTIAFAGTIPTDVLVNTIVTLYVAKVTLAVLDTPLVYAMVGVIRRLEQRLRLGLPGAID